MKASPTYLTSNDTESQPVAPLGMTLSELLRLPRAGIARRFGPRALLDLDIALARQAAPRQPPGPPSPQRADRP